MRAVATMADAVHPRATGARDDDRPTGARDDEARPTGARDDRDDNARAEHLRWLHGALTERTARELRGEETAHLPPRVVRQHAGRRGP